MELQSPIILVICCGWVVDVTADASGIPMSTSPSKFEQFRSLQSSLIHFNKITEENVKSRKALQEFHYFLLSVSPPHLLYFLYDQPSQDIDALMKKYGDTETDYTAVKVTPDLSQLYDILSSPLTIATTVRRHIFVLCTMQNITKIFEMVALRNLESPWLWWIVLTLDKEAAQILQGILREGSQVILVLKEKQNTFQLLSSRVNSNSRVRFHDIGYWMTTPNGHYSHLSEEVFTNLDDLYSNFEGRQLTVNSVNAEPYMAMQKQSNSDLSLVSGIDASVIKSLSSTLNFTYRMTTPADGKWGGPLKNGSVIGMIGVVARREAHFAICAIAFTRARETVIDFTFPYFMDGISLVSPSPKEKNRAFAAFSPFSFNVWLCIAVSTLAMGPILSMQTWFMNRYQTQQPESCSLKDFLFNMFRSLVKQENLLYSNYWPNKVTCVSWYFFSLILSVVYSGMLIASLVTPSYEKPVDSLFDLPEAIKEGLTLGVNADTSNEYMFKNAKEGIYKDTWNLFNHKDRSKSFLPAAQSHDKILEEKVVLIIIQTRGRFLSMKKGIHRYHIARETFAPQSHGLACFSGAPFLPKFDKMLSYMVEGGLIKKWSDEEFQKVAGSADFEQSAGPKAITLSHLQAAFYILLIGFLMAGLSLIFELISACCI